MTVKYKTVITKAGAIKLAAATVPNGKKVNFTAMAVGDGGGTLPVPDPSQTKLVKEVWRHALNKISQDAKNKNYVVAELLIPPETGGFWMREMGLYDDTGTLIAVGNMAESYKPELAEGSGRAQTVRMVIMLSDIESVELKIDTSMVMATQDYVDDKLAEHEQSRRHPDATLKEKGFTQLSSATNSASETFAATPKAVKAAYDLADGKYTAQDATTAQKGIVKLSSATDSTSEALAATPKAVKAAYDLADGKYTAQDATTAKKGIVQLSSATDSSSEVLAATPKAVKAVNDLVTSLKKSLGTSAEKDVTTSRYDTTSGHILQVGDYGWGTAGGLTALNSIFDITCTAKYAALGVGAGASATEGMPANSGNTRFSVEAESIYINQFWVTLKSSGQAYTGLVNTSTKTASWTQYYTEMNKPTAGDVDAVSASNGGTFKKEVSFQAGLNVRSLTGIYSGNDAAGFTSNNMLLKSWYGIGFYCTMPGSESVTGYINTRTGRLEMKEQVIPGNYTNFDARYQAKGSYTPAGQAYTKAESDARYNLKNTASKAANGWYKCGSTGLIIQWGSVTRTNYTTRVTFPIAFPAACVGVNATLRQSVSDISSSTQNIRAVNVSTTGFDYASGGNAETQSFWMAIGY